MCPRGMPPLRRSSRPTTYVGILSVACDRMEPPPDPTGGTGQRSPADKTLSREAYDHPTGFESRAGATPNGRRPSRGSTEPLNVRRCSGGDSDARDGCGRCPIRGRRQGEDRQLPCRPRGRRRAVPGRRERGPHGPSGRPAVRVSSAAFGGPPKAHDERDWERSGRRSGAAPDRDRGDPRPRPLGPEPAHQRPRPCRDAIPQDHRRPRGEIERQPGSRHDASRDRSLVRGQGGPFRDPHVRPRRSRRPPREARDDRPDQTEAHRCVRGTDRLDLEAIYKEQVEYGARLAPFVTDTSAWLDAAIRRRKRVLFEGAQGTHLCIDHGIYPFGTSSDCVAGAASVGAGVGPQFLTDIVGVAKAFTSRVGTGPFPTEVEGSTAEYLRERGGGEYGTTTRRPRRVGWLDLVMLRMAVRVNGLVSLAVTKLDVLGGLDRIPVGVGYRADGETVKEFPASMRVLSRCEPVYREFKGWPDLNESNWIATAKKGKRALPDALRKYLEFIEAQLKVPVRIISVGRPRAATIGH